MKKILVTALIGASLLAACVVAPSGRHGRGGQGGVMIAPLLPSVVVFDAEPYYYQEGYHYHYVNNTWYYAKSRNGPWRDLPRDRYPREVKYKGRGGGHDHDNRRDGNRHDDNRRDNDRRYDNQRDDDRNYDNQFYNHSRDDDHRR